MKVIQVEKERRRQIEFKKKSKENYNVKSNENAIDDFKEEENRDSQFRESKNDNGKRTTEALREAVVGCKRNECNADVSVCVVDSNALEANTSHGRSRLIHH